jgi:type IV pilus modification protein PilV
LPIPISGRRGISLLEVMISMVIIALGILAMAPLMVASINANADSRDRSVATQLAKEKLEDLESANSLSGLPSMDTEDGLRTKFSRTTTILDSDADTLIPDSRFKVMVVVSWLDDNQRTQATTLSTLIGKK